MAELPFSPSRVTQAHNARVLHRTRVVQRLVVFLYALVHACDGGHEFALMKQDVCDGPGRLQPSHWIGRAGQHRRSLHGIGMCLFEVRAHEMVAFQSQAYLDQRASVAHCLAKLQGTRVDPADLFSAVALCGDELAGEQQLQSEFGAVALRRSIEPRDQLQPVVEMADRLGMR